MKYLKYFENLEYIYYSNQNLTTLKDKNIPKHISGSFWCNDNQLISLEYCPETVGGGFDCSNNQLTSLEYGPKTVNGYFNCRNNELTSLEFCPEYINGNFDCRNNELTSLEHCPEHVGGYFDCSYNQLTSLEFCPETVDGFFWCNNNPWTNVIPYGFKSDNNSTGNVGLVWNTNKKSKNSEERSIDISKLESLINSDLTIHNLQKGISDERMINYDFKDFLDTKKVIDTLDCVYTVDTSVAHLSALLGKKTYILYDTYLDWRWKSQYYNNFELLNIKDLH